MLSVKPCLRCDSCLNRTIIYLRFQVLTAASVKFRIVFWDVLAGKINLDRKLPDDWVIMVAAHTSETSVDNYTTILYGSTFQKTILNLITSIFQNV
jgi:hypothetical protein